MKENSLLATAQTFPSPEYNTFLNINITTYLKTTITFNTALKNINYIQLNKIKVHRSKINIPINFTDPQEVKIVKKECFNRWYGLTPYYMALTVSRIPLQVI